MPPAAPAPPLEAVGLAPVVELGPVGTTVLIGSTLSFPQPPASAVTEVPSTKRNA